MTCMPNAAPSSASAAATRRFRSSDSTTHGPAMRNGTAPPWAAKCCATSVASTGELRPLDLGGGGQGPGAMLLARRAHEPGEQRVRPRGTRLQLRMELAADEPRVVGQLDHLHQRAVGREAGAAHAVFGEYVAVGVRHLVAMPVPLADFERPAGLCG